MQPPHLFAQAFDIAVEPFSDFCISAHVKRLTGLPYAG